MGNLLRRYRNTSSYVDHDIATPPSPSISPLSSPSIPSVDEEEIRRQKINLLLETKDEKSLEQYRNIHHDIESLPSLDHQIRYGDTHYLQYAKNRDIPTQGCSTYQGLIDRVIKPGLKERGNPHKNQYNYLKNTYTRYENLREEAESKRSFLRTWGHEV